MGMLIKTKWALCINCLKARLKKRPEQTALVAKDGTYTYRNLNEAANRVANALLKEGLAVEERVAFALPRDGRLIAVMLGILKAGGAYIPIDPEYPAGRIEQILADSSAKYMIGCAQTPLTSGAELLDVDALLAEDNQKNPDVAVLPEHLAYIIYTSGSTGKPKGVMLEHKGISNYVTPAPANIHVRALMEDAHAMLSVTTVSSTCF